MNPVFPLLALRAFTEVGRHGSIKRAAAALGVTSGAVSQQVRLLEERVGLPLFTRGRQSMALTEAGARVHPGLLTAFDQIESALRTLEAARARKTLTVSTMASFAASWLVPRLGRFTSRHPDIEVRVEAVADLVDLHRDRVDIAIRHGLGSYPGLQSRPLMAPVLLPVASPALLADGPPIREPADCLAYPLLQDGCRADWGLWLAAHGVAADPRAERGTAFGEDYLLIRAAAAGQGLALVPQAYAREEIAAGRLALALDRPWPARFAYYVVMLPDVARRPEAAAFAAWLEEEAQQPA
ncbi:transcriptional regulator [Achromobacter sp. HZ01]|jgi:LysR family glycine cleavage system transcriptional activator|uniref:LysR substrate-binding domain-containing protein n=1 Tax=Achromobacter sp. HZ01 TaxID=1416886 RepID=UPI000DC2D686|nr:LysR substrate-binding domain-containing protein [Achromobacter sp. HZ01]MBO9332063.1 LysR family transcriptional regulator [Achromobacter xylosoxidans]RAP63086.1 transcriptional regulator [Achromobacter sp. HZ01]